jgi:hypothetical protein
MFKLKKVGSECLMKLMACSKECMGQSGEKGAV